MGTGSSSVSEGYPGPEVRENIGGTASSFD